MTAPHHPPPPPPPPYPPPHTPWTTKPRAGAGTWRSSTGPHHRTGTMRRCWPRSTSRVHPRHRRPLGRRAAEFRQTLSTEESPPWSGDAGDRTSNACRRPGRRRIGCARWSTKSNRSSKFRGRPASPKTFRRRRARERTTWSRSAPRPPRVARIRIWAEHGPPAITMTLLPDLRRRAAAGSQNGRHFLHGLLSRAGDDGDHPDATAT